MLQPVFLIFFKRTAALVSWLDLLLFLPLLRRYKAVRIHKREPLSRLNSGTDLEVEVQQTHITPHLQTPKPPTSTMKIAITITVVMLSICCSSASSDICPGFLQVLEALLMESESGYVASLKPFNPGSDLQNAGTQLKRLVDTLPQETRINIMKLTEKILTSPLCKQDLRF